MWPRTVPQETTLWIIVLQNGKCSLICTTHLQREHKQRGGSAHTPPPEAIPQRSAPYVLLAVGFVLFLSLWSVCIVLHRLGMRLQRTHTHTHAVAVLWSCVVWSDRLIAGPVGSTEQKARHLFVVKFQVFIYLVVKDLIPANEASECHLRDSVGDGCWSFTPLLHWKPFTGFKKTVRLFPLVVSLCAELKPQLWHSSHAFVRMSQSCLDRVQSSCSWSSCYKSQGPHKQTIKSTYNRPPINSNMPH